MYCFVQGSRRTYTARELSGIIYRYTKLYILLFQNAVTLSALRIIPPCQIIASHFPLPLSCGLELVGRLNFTMKLLYYELGHGWLRWVLNPSLHPSSTPYSSWGHEGSSFGRGTHTLNVGSWGVSRPALQYNIFTCSWVIQGASSQLNTPGTPT